MSSVHCATVGGSAAVRTERRGSVVTLILDGPENRNALSADLLGGLEAELARTAGDPSVRAVVLTAAGDVFCSGADLRERLAGPAPPSAGAPSLARVLTALVALPQPVVARVNGHARAGGLGLIACCDLAAAPPWATFALSEVRVGVAPAVISVPLLRVMGRRSFLRRALTGEAFSAPEAVADGLLTAAVDDLDGWVAARLAALERGAPRALASTKELPGLSEGATWAEALRLAEDLSGQLFAGPEAAEGMAAFLEKRAPSWTEAR